MIAYAALWIFVFSVPWEDVVVIPGLGVVSRLTGVLALGLALLAAVVSGRFRRWDLLHVAALLYVLLAVCTVLVFGSETVPKKLWTYLQLFLVLWMIWELAPSRKRQLGLLTAYVFGAYVSAFSTIMALRRDTGARRFSAGGFDANDLAAILALALPMAWYLGTVHHRPLVRFLCRAYLPLGVLAIGLTGSRGGMLATIVALLIVPLTMTKLSVGRLVTTIALVVISGSLAVAYVPETVIERLATTRSEVQEGRLGGRLKLWVAGSKAFARRPMLGYGTSGFRNAIAPYLPTRPQVAHNSYLSVLVEQGIVGFVLYSLMFFAVFRAVLGLPTLDRRFSLILLATLGVIMIPLTWEDHKALWFILAALLGLARASAREGGAVPHPYPQPSVANPPFARPPQPLGARRGNAARDARA